MIFEHKSKQSNFFCFNPDSVLFCGPQEIKLTSLRGRAAGQEDEVEGSVEAQAQAAVSAVAKKAFISQVVRRNVIENIVPVVISLKHMVGLSLIMLSQRQL